MSEMEVNTQDVKAEEVQSQDVKTDSVNSNEKAEDYSVPASRFRELNQSKKNLATEISN